MPCDSGLIRRGRIHHRRDLHLGGFLAHGCGSGVRQRAETILRPACDAENALAPPDEDLVRATAGTGLPVVRDCQGER